MLMEFCDSTNNSQGILENILFSTQWKKDKNFHDLIYNMDYLILKLILVYNKSNLSTYVNTCI